MDDFILTSNFSSTILNTSIHDKKFPFQIMFSSTQCQAVGLVAIILIFSYLQCTSGIIVHDVLSLCNTNVRNLHMTLLQAQQVL